MQSKFLPSLVPLSPTELYLRIVGSTYDALRVEDLEYMPAQFGGLMGQHLILKEQTIIEATDFVVRD